MTITNVHDKHSATSQAFQSFPTEQGCKDMRDTIVTGGRIIDQGNKRIAIEKTVDGYTLITRTGICQSDGAP
jgi:hypothetical protein